MKEQAAGMGPRASLRITASDYPGRRSRLCEDVVAGEGRIREFLGPRFDDATALRELISALHRRNYPRSGLTAILKEFACAVDAPSAVEEQIERLRDASAVTVFAGQQAGLFTGPLLTIYKALSVERWADDLERAFSVPVIACFWIADDDHDFAEIDHVEFPSGTAVERIRYDPSQAPSGAPVGRHRIDSGIEPVFARLEEQLPESEYKTGVLQTLKEAYAPGTGFGQAFARLWYRMFPASKLVFVSGSNERLKRLSAPLLATSALEHARLFDIYENTCFQLTACGYHCQVRKRRDQSFLFYQHGKRSGIRCDSQGLCHIPGKPPITSRRLAEIVRERPPDFSPNVLLRPLVQNFLFPVLGVVLGPAEMAYHAQIAGLHDWLGLRRPAVQPRTTATLLERRAARRIGELGIDLGALALNAEGETARVLATGFPSALDAGFCRTAGTIEAAITELAEELEQFDTRMAKLLPGCGKRVQRELERAAKKARAIFRRSQREKTAHIKRLSVQLYPCGELQERRYNIVWYWARYGPAVMGELRRQWPEGGHDHLLLRLE